MRKGVSEGLSSTLECRGSAGLQSLGSFYAKILLHVRHYIENREDTKVSTTCFSPSRCLSPGEGSDPLSFLKRSHSPLGEIEASWGIRPPGREATGMGFKEGTGIQQAWSSDPKHQSHAFWGQQPKLRVPANFSWLHASQSKKKYVFVFFVSQDQKHLLCVVILDQGRQQREREMETSVSSWCH